MSPRSLLFSALLLLAGCNGEAPWALEPEDGAAPPHVFRLSPWEERTAGLPPNQDIQGLTQVGGEMYAIVQGRLFTFDVDLLTWQPVAVPLEAGEAVEQIAGADVGLYATAANWAAGTGGVYRMDLKTGQWARLVSAPSLPASALVKKGSEVWVAFAGEASAAGLYASADRGERWTRRSNPQVGGALFAQRVRTLCAAPEAQRVFATGVDAFDGLYFSDDGGQSWYGGLLEGPVQALHAGGRFALVTLEGKGAHRSDDYGATFSPLGTMEAVSYFVTSARSFAGLKGEVKISDDGGLHWRDGSAGLPNAEVRRLTLSGRSLYSASGSQVFVSNLE